MSYGLKNESMQQIRNVLQRHTEVDQAILYGSRAKGNFKPGSDIDLTLKGPGLSLRQLNAIAIELDDLLLPYEIDLSVYDDIENPDLLDHIDQVGILFYQKQI